MDGSYPELYGIWLHQRVYWRLQQQDQSSEAQRLRYARFQTIQKQDPILLLRAASVKKNALRYAPRVIFTLIDFAKTFF